jgi:hypothetical protein
MRGDIRTLSTNRIRGPLHVDTLLDISSAPLDIDRLALGVRGPGGGSLHWLLNVEFKDDHSRYRAGHGAQNMADVRRSALGVVRVDKARGSVKARRKKLAGTPTISRNSCN